MSERAAVLSDDNPAESGRIVETLAGDFGIAAETLVVAIEDARDLYNAARANAAPADRQPVGPTAVRLKRIGDLPASWAEQRWLLGFL